jgi:hypothetical protein
MIIGSAAVTITLSSAAMNGPTEATAKTQLKRTFAAASCAPA